MKRDLRPRRPCAALAAILLGVLPLQLGVVTPLTMGPEMAHAAISGASQPLDPSPLGSDTEHHEMPTEEMPCGEDGLCDSGLMYCSAAGTMCTLLFFSPAEDLLHAVRTTAVDDGWNSEPTPVTVHAGHRTPPPRA